MNNEDIILTPEFISSISPSREDIVMNHAVFMQCFLPMRSLPKDQETFTTKNGKVSLTIHAGYTHIDETPTKMEVPAGSKARLILNYVNQFCFYHKTDTVNMGKSLNQFMTNNNIPIGGKNLKELRRQVRNIAAANIVIGLFHENGDIETRFSRIVSGMLVTGEERKTDWNETIYLDKEYVQSLKDHGVPADIRILAALANNPRAMDIYSWLTYRAPGVKYPLKITYKTLHSMFGHGISDLRNFKIHFLKALTLVCQYYSEVIIDINDKDYLILFKSPPSIPRETFKINY